MPVEGVYSKDVTEISCPTTTPKELLVLPDIDLLNESIVLVEFTVIEFVCPFSISEIT